MCDFNCESSSDQSGDNLKSRSVGDYINNNLLYKTCQKSVISDCDEAVLNPSPCLCIC